MTTPVRRRRLRRSLLALLLVFLLVAAGVAYASWRSADELVHPTRQARTATPEDVGLAYEDINLVADDGTRLAAWWMPAEDARGTIIFLHGYGESKNQSLTVAPFLQQGGYHVLALDFRAHGESDGDYTTVGLVEVADVKAAHEWVQTRDPHAPVALFGFSMGAATALNSADDLPGVRAVVADSAFATLENIASNSITHFTDLPKYPFGPLSVVMAGWMVGADVGDNAPVRAAAGLDAPVLVIQGSADTIAYPHEDGHAIFLASPAGSEYWLVEGATHVRAHHADASEYERRVLAFLDAHMTRAD